jgi:hypothetical protein
MKRKYGLESIIGKTSSLRYPRLVFIEQIETINCILPANTEEIESSFNTALTMKSADPEEAYDQFNDVSCDYDDEFPIRVKVTIQGPIFFIDVLDPSVFSLLNIAFDLEETHIEKFRASISDILVITTNFALIKYKPEDSYFVSDLIANLRTILCNIMSYNCGRKSIKMSNITNLKFRLQRYLLNIKSHFNRHYHHKKLYHFCHKALNYQEDEPIPMLIDRIDYFYDILDDWDDAYDFAWSDQLLILLDDLNEYILLADEFALLENGLDDDLIMPSELYQNYSSQEIMDQLISEYDLDLIESFKMSLKPY